MADVTVGGTFHRVAPGCDSSAGTDTTRRAGVRASVLEVPVHWKVGLKMDMGKRALRSLAPAPSRVLIAHPHRLVRSALRVLLERTGRFAVVGEAATPAELAALLGQVEAEVALVDGQFPIVELGATDIAAVLVTGRVDRRHVVDALQAGFRGYVTTDVDGGELAAAIDAVLDGRRYMSPRISADALGGYLAEAMAGGSVERARELSTREREILELLVAGKSNREIGAALHISAHTVDSHRRNIMTKLDAKNVVELVRNAIRAGLVALDP